jgi:hypothetical protein
MTERTLYIQSVVEKSIAFSNTFLDGLQAPDAWVPKEMIADTKNLSYDESYVFWKPIPANLSKERLQEYEAKVGFLLPDSYKDFLSYKYFIELNFGHEANFFRHTSTFIEDYYEHFSKFELDETLRKGLIPFAYDTDRGCFCFDTNNFGNEKEYKIVSVMWGYDAQEYPSLQGQYTFVEFVKELDKRLTDWEQLKLTSA